MVLDLEKALQDAVEELRKRIEQNPRLKPEGYTALIPNELKDKNCFEMQKNLVRRLKKAYQEENLDELEKLPNCYGYIGDNTITYCFSPNETLQPFSNESSGENVYWASTVFYDLAHSDRPTSFYDYLCQLIQEFEKERNQVRDEILATPTYQAAREKVIQARKLQEEALKSDNHTYEQSVKNLKKEMKNLRQAYHKEELNRNPAVLELCEKAEFIYGLSSRLFENLSG